MNRAGRLGGSQSAGERGPEETTAQAVLDIVAQHAGPAAQAHDPGDRHARLHRTAIPGVAQDRSDPHVHRRS